MLINKDFGNISCSPWIKINMSIWGSLVSDFPLNIYKANSILFEENQNLSFVYIIKGGRIRLTVSCSKNDKKHVIIAEEGCLIGENSCILNVPSISAATTIVETSVFAIPKNDFLNYIYNTPNINKAVMHIISFKNHILTKQIMDLSFSSSTERVAKALCDLVDLYGIKYGNKHKINIKFTHQDIAYLINTSRVTASKVFSYLSEEGIIDREDGYIIINNIEKLESLHKDYWF